MSDRIPSTMTTAEIEAMLGRARGHMMDLANAVHLLGGMNAALKQQNLPVNPHIETLAARLQARAEAINASLKREVPAEPTLPGFSNAGA